MPQQPVPNLCRLGDQVIETLQACNKIRVCKDDICVSSKQFRGPSVAPRSQLVYQGAPPLYQLQTFK